MKRFIQRQNGRGSRWLSPRLAMSLLMAIVSLQIASPAEADIDFGVHCDPPIIDECVLVPILREEQFLLTTPVPDIFPIGPCDECPPFIEIFDIPELDPGEVEPPPPWEARVRLFGGPQPEPPTIDNPNIPNLLLIFAGPNDIAGPMEFDAFTLPVPQGITKLQYYAQAFDAQGNVVSNVGIIRIPEPNSVVLLISGAAMCSWFAGRARESH